MTSTYVAVDIETTGLDNREDDIIEVAAVVFRDDQILEEWSSLVSPERDLPPEIIQLTGITPAMLTNAPTIRQLKGKIREMLGGHVIVGHNVSFDMGFLERSHIGVQQHRIDTITLASILLPTAGRYGLQALTQALQLPRSAEDRHHRALADARVTAALFFALRQRALALDFAILDEIVEAGKGLMWPETVFFEDVLRGRLRHALDERTQRRRHLFRPPELEGHVLHPRDPAQPIDVDLVISMLQPEGNFGRAFPNYEFRPQQVQMAAAVARAFNDGRHLIVEAGTGTGKSIGYLLPAAFWAHENERPVVVSTNTINLQDQLIYKDIPELQRLLPFEIHSAILKGKRNYLCTRLFQEMRASRPGNADEATLFARILVWLPNSARGDVSEISLRTPREQLIWNRLSADNDGCDPNACAQEYCPLHAARRRAEQSHILIVNHSLVLADVATGNRVLPAYKDLIIDEAHHLESAVTDGLSFQADKGFLEAMLEDLTRPRAGLLARLQTRISEALSTEAAAIFAGRINSLRVDAMLATERLEEFLQALDYFVTNQANERNSGFATQVRLLPALRAQPLWDSVAISWENLNNVMTPISKQLHKIASGFAELLDMGLEVTDGADLQAALQGLSQNVIETRDNLHKIIAEPQEGMIYWIEQFGSRLTLRAAPLHIGPLVETHIFSEKETVILTSATLRTARDGTGEVSFDYLRDRLHAQHADELSVGSPFNYKQSTLVYLVTDMPEPRQPGYQRYVEDAIVAVAAALGGRTLVLFTAYGQLSTTATAIARRLAEADITLLQQDSGASRQQLLEAFRAPGSRSVLLGTRSFWEGVDVPGEGLQAVIIVKLPFDVPSDPIFAARSETFEYPFYQYSIPEAVLRFRQGFGRLIRRRDDSGVVVILDKRVLTKRYGQAFMEALPECVVLRQRHARLGEIVTRWLNRELESA